LDVVCYLVEECARTVGAARFLFGPGVTAMVGTVPGSGFGVQYQAFRLPLTGAGGVVHAHRKTVDAGAVEAGNIELGDDGARQNPAKRSFCLSSVPSLT
jgi:hypothetical protein